MKLQLISLILFLAPIFTIGQTAGYEFNDQSGNLEVSVFAKTKITLIFYKDYDYKISFISDEYVGQIRFRLKNSTGDMALLFDNARENYVQEKHISVQNTTKLLVEVSIPKGVNTSPDAVKSGWAALLVEHKAKK